MTDRLRSAVERTRKAATGAGSFNTNAPHERANAKNQTTPQKADGETSGRSGRVSIKVSDCWVGSVLGRLVRSTSDDESEHTNPRRTERQRPIGDGRELEGHESWRGTARINHAQEGMGHE